MAKIVSWILIGLSVLFCLTYIHRTLNDNSVHPSVATWLIFVVATIIVVTSYKKAGKGDNRRGTLILSDAIATWIVFGAVVYASGRTLHFRTFDIWYLAGAFAITLFWFITQNHFAANLLVQALIVIGYLPMFHKFIADKVSTEPFLPWIITFAASTCGAILAWLPHDGTDETRTDKILATVYAWRSIVCCGLVIFLMLLYR